jgi:hypothetical protein
VTTASSAEPNSSAHFRHSATGWFAEEWLPTYSSSAEPRLPPWWLNEQASAYVSTQPDAGRREVFDHPGIRVMAASPEHVFAMKAFAARSRDEDDLRALAAIIGISAVESALDLCRRFFPDEELPARSRAMLVDLFA